MVRDGITLLAIAGVCTACAMGPTASPVKTAGASDTVLRPVTQTRRLCEDPPLLVRDLTVRWDARAYLQGPCPDPDSPSGTQR